MNRVIIIGVTGSGKTTLGQQLEKKLGLEAIDLDELHWLPNWESRELGELRALINQRTNAPRWVTSGNYTRTQDVFYHKGDILIWLDYSMPFTFMRLLRRSLRRAFLQEELFNGCTESVSKLFRSDGIIAWFFKSFHSRKEKALALFENPEQYPNLTMLRFKTPKETQQWLDSLH